MASQVHHRAVKTGDQVRAKGSTTCTIHNEKEIVFLCKTCNDVLCAKCTLSGQHRDHDLGEISDTESENQEVLVEFINRSERKNLPNILEAMNVTDQRIQDTDLELQRLFTMFKEQGKTCYNAAHTVIEEMSEECKEMVEKNKTLLREYKDHLQTKYDALTNQTGEYKRILQTGRYIMLHDTATEINNAEPGSLTDATTMPTLFSAEFCPGTPTSNNVRPLIGKLNIQQAETSKTSIKLEAKRLLKIASGKVTTGISIIQSRLRKLPLRDRVKNCKKIIMRKETALLLVCFICIVIFKIVDDSYAEQTHKLKTSIRYGKAVVVRPTRDGYAWVLHRDFKQIELIDSDGAVVDTVNTGCYGQLRDISVSPITGHLWFCCTSKPSSMFSYFHENAIKTITKSANSPVTVFTTTAEPLAMCVTNEGHVIVSTLNCVRIHKVNGEVLYEYCREPVGWIEWFTTLPKEPFSITQCPVTGNIAVLYDFNIYTDIELFRQLRLQNTYTDSYRYRATLTEYPATSISYDSIGNWVLSAVVYNELIVWNGTPTETIYSYTVKETDAFEGAIGIDVGDVIWAVMKTSDAKWKVTKIQHSPDNE